jgi:DNA polymerase-4
MQNGQAASKVEPTVPLGMQPPARLIQKNDRMQSMASGRNFPHIRRGFALSSLTIKLMDTRASGEAIAEVEPSAKLRKIVHVDMDAFYASVEQRDDPSLRGRPVVVAWKGKRSVVCAASYEARRFGVRSAMPAIQAERQCPQAIFVPPDFTRYKAVSRAVREIFQRHSDLIEPLSLDEAYLDVTTNKTGLPTATKVAIAIRQQIREELSLTASAGVAPNKFLAKIASDWRKPDGLFVIQPADLNAFLPPLQVGRIPGVGKVTEARLKQIGIQTVGDLQGLDLESLEAHFGRYGGRLYELARGVDDNPVIADRPTKSISAEDTFEHDIPLSEMDELIRRLAEKVWTASRRESRIPRTVVLKLKTKEFNTLTRSHTPITPPASCEELTAMALALRERIDLGPARLFRLVGVGLSNFRELDGPSPPLFESDAIVEDNFSSI